MSIKDKHAQKLSKMLSEEKSAHLARESLIPIAIIRVEEKTSPSFSCIEDSTEKDRNSSHCSKLLLRSVSFSTYVSDFEAADSDSDNVEPVKPVSPDSDNGPKQIRSSIKGSKNFLSFIRGSVTSSNEKYFPTLEIETSDHEAVHVDGSESEGLEKDIVQSEQVLLEDEMDETTETTVKIVEGDENIEPDEGSVVEEPDELINTEQTEEENRNNVIANILEDLLIRCMVKGEQTSVKYGSIISDYSGTSIGETDSVMEQIKTKMEYKLEEDRPAVSEQFLKTTDLSHKEKSRQMSGTPTNVKDREGSISEDKRELCIFSNDSSQKIYDQAGPLDKKEQEALLNTLKTKLHDLSLARRKNKYLSKSLISYFKLKQIDYAFTEGDHQEELINKYSRRLKLYEEIKQMTNNERQKKEAEMKELEDELDELRREYSKEMKGCIQREMDIGKTLVDPHTGNPVAEKTIHALTHRHCTIAKRLCVARLKLIKLEALVATEEAKLKNFDKFGKDLSLIEYEQLKVDNQNLVDKLEEREDELTSFRTRIENSIHQFSHISEKADECMNDIEKYQSSSIRADFVVTTNRQLVNKLKQKRDVLRYETNKLKKQAGVLIRPRLVVDLKNCYISVEKEKAKLEKMMKTVSQNKDIILSLRKKIENTVEENECSIKVSVPR